ncbi:MAG: MBL fold metallo-hydrolase, partial [bacterium]
MAIVEKLKHYNVEGIRLGRFTSKIYTTCIVYRLGTTVIDTGPPNQWKFVRTFLHEKKIHQVLITHHHEDHGGNGARLQTEMNAPVLSHRNGVSNHAKGFPLQIYRRITWGTPAKF